MSSFKSKKIFLEAEAIAEILSQARKEKKISLEEAAEETGIQKKYLQILEKGDFASLPAGTYGKSFLKEYALFLGIDYKELLASLDEEKDFSNPPGRENLFSRQVLKKRYLLFFPKIVKNIIIILVVLGCFIYLGFSFKRIISSPELFLLSPEKNITIHEGFINVIGSTEPEAQVEINGEMVNVNNAGDFSKQVNLKTGMNIIKVSAKKKYSQTNIIERYILVEP